MDRIAGPRYPGPSRSSAVLAWLGTLLLFSALACGDSSSPPEAGEGSLQELRAAGTYVAAPPSLHPVTNKRYIVEKPDHIKLCLLLYFQ